MKPSWKRCSSLKVSAKAWRRLSEGRARSRLCWNWEKMPWRREQEQEQELVCTCSTGHFVCCYVTLAAQYTVRICDPARRHIHKTNKNYSYFSVKYICTLPLKHKRCRNLLNRSVQVAASSCVWRCPAAIVPTQRIEKEVIIVTINPRNKVNVFKNSEVFCHVKNRDRHEDNIYKVTKDEEWARAITPSQKQSQG